MQQKAGFLNLDDVRIVLVGTTHPGNIGATARAMHTMGLTDLRLVAPKVFPHAEATARASGSQPLLDAARVSDTLDEALAGCELVIGASARLRSLSWPVLDPAAAGRLAAQEPDGRRLAVVFGREKTGLSNDELERCHYLLHIDTNPDFRSLNLAMAVQVVGYELRRALHEAPAPVAEEGAVRLATHDEMQYFYDHLERVMLATGFLNPDNPRHLVRRLKRLFNRARPDHNEVNILRGILTAMEEHLGDDAKSDRR